MKRGLRWRRAATVNDFPTKLTVEFNLNGICTRCVESIQVKRRPIHAPVGVHTDSPLHGEWDRNGHRCADRNLDRPARDERKAEADVMIAVIFIGALPTHDTVLSEHKEISKLQICTACVQKFNGSHNRVSRKVTKHYKIRKLESAASLPPRSARAAIMMDDNPGHEAVSAGPTGRLSLCLGYELGLLYQSRSRW